MQLKNNQRLKEFLISFVLIIVPLALGTFIYIMLEPNSDLHKLFYTVFPNSNIGLKTGTVHRNRCLLLCRYYMCDILWAFSLESCIYLILKGVKKQFLISAIIAMAFSVFIEIIQGFHLIPGIFDIKDIIVEMIAVFIAGIINYYVFRRKKYENK